MNVLHVNAGNEYGGGLYHILALFEAMKHAEIEMHLLVFEEGPVAREARHAGIKVFVLKQSSRYDLRVLHELRALIRKNHYDIIHTHGPRANTLVARILKKVKKVKWVVTLHSQPFLDFKDRGIKGKIFERINLRAIKKADFTIAVSREIRKAAMENGAPEERSRVVHNGVDFSQSKIPLSKGKTFTLCGVGRLEWVKGFSFLLEALKEADLPDWTLQLCGDGSQVEKLKKQAEEFGIRSRIQFLGWLKKLEVEECMAHADILVLPSLSESFPLVALEAGKFALPVIASNVGDVEEILPSEELGWLVESENIAEWSNALWEAYFLWEKEELFNKGKVFSEWAKQFSTKKQAKETYQIYQETLKKESLFH